MHKRKQQEDEHSYMEDEMQEAQRKLDERRALADEDVRASVRKTRIATPGVRAPGTPRHTPKRFGL